MTRLTPKIEKGIRDKVAQFRQRGYERELLAEIDALRSDLATAVKALENCCGGDLASGEDIYKAEIARAALATIHWKS